MDERTVRCPYCGALMQCCSFYNLNTLYGQRDLSYAYKCTECGASGPPVKADKIYWSCSGGPSLYVEQVKRIALEKALARKAKFDDSEV